MPEFPAPLRILQEEIERCVLCPRLVEYRRQIAVDKRRAYRDWTYWGRPVPGFGEPTAGLLLIGLAPGAHGANRTGRMFTGDSSGDLLYKVLFDTGFASQPSSTSIHDGLVLTGAYIGAAVRCAPPDNKPSPLEVRTCTPYLEREIKLLPNLRVVVALGRLAFDVYRTILKRQGLLPRGTPHLFAHNRLHDLGPGLPALITSYHPSRQNTSTGKLTEPMFRAVFEQARGLLQSADGRRGRRPSQ